MRTIKTKLIEIAFSIHAIKLNPADPFLWASGYSMPIYNDNRLFLQSYHYRRLIADAFVEIINTNNIKADVVAGTATAGIPHATTLADTLSLPMTYIREKNKTHGLGNRIEGILSEKGYEGKTVLLIEDLISTGGSSIEAVKAIREAGGRVEYCLSIFNYRLKKAADNFSSLTPPCSVKSIMYYNDLLVAAEEKGLINGEDLISLEEWRKAPFKWGDKHGFPCNNQKEGSK